MWVTYCNSVSSILKLLTSVVETIVRFAGLVAGFVWTLFGLGKVEHSIVRSTHWGIWTDPHVPSGCSSWQVYLGLSVALSVTFHFLVYKNDLKLHLNQCFWYVITVNTASNCTNAIKHVTLTYPSSLQVIISSLIFFVKWKDGLSGSVV